MESSCQVQELIHIQGELERQTEDQLLSDTVVETLESTREDYNQHLGDHTYAIICPRAAKSTCGNYHRHLRDHTYAIIYPPLEVNSDIQSVKTELIKEETECVDNKQQYSNIERALNELTPNTDMLKDELVLIPEHVKQLLQLDVSEPDSHTNLPEDVLIPNVENPYTNPDLEIKDELPDKSECVTETLLAELYTDHAVKDEIVLGPEHPHRPDVTLAVRSRALPDENRWSSTAAPVRARLKQLKDCYVRLERLKAMQTGYQTKDPTHADKSYIEKKYTPRQSICGLCGEAFNLKADLMTHVMRHIYMPTSVEKEQRLLFNYEKLRSSIRDCWVTLERLDSTYQNPTKAVMSSTEDTILPHPENAEQKTRAIQKQPRAIQKQPKAIQKQPRAIQNQPRAIEKQPRAIQKQSRAIQKQSRAIQKQSRAIQKQPKATQKQPRAIQKQPKAIQKQSRAIQKQPRAIQKQPRAIQKQSRAIQKQPLPHKQETNYYICDLCHETFKEKHSLVKHIKVHLETRLLPTNTTELDVFQRRRKKPYTCVPCKRVFKLERELIRHEIRHSGQKPYSCLICEKRFARADYIQLHTRIVHGNAEKTFSCNICQAKFKNLMYLKKHKLIHTNRQLHYCKICNKTFKHLDLLRIHTKIHIGERKHKCHICNKRFLHSCSLRRHQRVHDKKRPFSCDICSKKFTFSQTLRTHQRIHTGLKPYACEICNKKFGQRASLKSHALIHESVKRYKCDICLKAYRHSASLYRHKLIHVGEKKHLCEICDKRFLLSDHLKQHLVTHMDTKPFSCEVCKMAFVCSEYLKRHRRVHNREEKN